jgi:hypothetical protein
VVYLPIFCAKTGLSGYQNNSTLLFPNRTSAINPIRHLLPSPPRVTANPHGLRDFTGGEKLPKRSLGNVEHQSDFVGIIGAGLAVLVLLLL